MSWIHRIPGIGDLIDLGQDIAYELRRRKLDKQDEKTPILFEDEVLGTFKFWREAGSFETRRIWGNAEVAVSLNGGWGERTDYTEEVAAVALGARIFWADQPGWQTRIEECIRRDLFELAQEWAADADETITPDDLITRIRIDGIGFEPGGHFCVWYDGGTAFGGGHGVTVVGNLETGPEYAEMHG